MIMIILYIGFAYALDLDLCPLANGESEVICNVGQEIILIKSNSELILTVGSSCSSTTAQDYTILCSGTPIYAIDSNNCITTSDGQIQIPTPTCPDVGDIGDTGGEPGDTTPGGGTSICVPDVDVTCTRDDSATSDCADKTCNGGCLENHVSNDGICKCICGSNAPIILDSSRTSHTCPGTTGEGCDTTSGTGEGDDSGTSTVDCSLQFDCTVRQFNESNTENIIGTCEVGETLISSSLRRTCGEANNNECADNNILDGNILLLHMDDNNGGKTTDSSGNSFDATNHGASFTNNGKINGAWDLDGDDDYLEIPDHNKLDLTGNFTISAWVYPRDWGENDQGRIVCHGGDEGNGYCFHVIGHGRLMIQINDDLHATSVNVTYLNEWHHVAVTRSGTTITFYGDGVAKGTRNSAAPIGSSHGVRIGASNENDYRDFEGSIDEVAIWNRALSEEEISVISSGEEIGTCTPIDNELGNTCTYIGDEFRDESTAVSGTVLGASTVEQSVLCCDTDLFESCRVVLFNTNTNDQITGSCNQNEFLVSASLSRESDSSNNPYQFFGDYIGQNGTSWTGHIAGGYGVDLRLKCCTPKYPDMLNVCTVREFTTTETESTFSCESGESMISGSMYVNNIDNESQGYVGDYIPDTNTWWASAQTGSSTTVKLKCCDFSTLDLGCIGDGDCLTDSDCDEFNRDYCADSIHMLDSATCVDGECMIQTSQLDDCAYVPSFCDGTTYFEFFCEKGTGCIEENFPDDNRCCSEDADCSPDRCEDTIFFDSRCNEANLCEVIETDVGNNYAPKDCNITIMDLSFNKITQNLKRHEYILNVNLFDKRKIYSILQTAIDVNDNGYNFAPSDMTSEDDDYNYLGILDFSGLDPNNQFNINFEIQLLDEYNHETYCIDSRIIELLGFLDEPGVSLE